MLLMMMMVLKRRPIPRLFNAKLRLKREMKAHLFRLHPNKGSGGEKTTETMSLNGVSEETVASREKSCVGGGRLGGGVSVCVVQRSRTHGRCNPSPAAATQGRLLALGVLESRDRWDRGLGGEWPPLFALHTKPIDFVSLLSSFFSPPFLDSRLC